MTTSKTSDHILIVDDDREIRELLTTYLVKNGLRVVAVPTGRHMRAALEESGPFDLIILDLMLPGEDGLTLCRDLRTGKYKATPILMLTARSEEADRILGLEMGADDYLPKPFEPRELLARIRSVLRRSHAMPPNSQTENVQQMRFSGWTLDLTARHLVNPQGVVIMLSGAEFRLLRVFLEHPNRVLNRDQLLNLTQGRDADPFDRSIDIQISRLRQKLGEDARMPQIIKTVRNGGYVLAGQVTVEPSA
jgi:two-component system OmpR family response regulator